MYSLFWGFQQVSTLAGNQVPSQHSGEVAFVLAVICLGLLLFALLIGNMQNFLQSFGRRASEKQLRRDDIERWMARRVLPPAFRKCVRQLERYTWAASRGVDEEGLLGSLPTEMQRDARRFLCLDLVRK
eukprot:SM003963S15176  [mRNA]  locus=s3963:209:888:- [translate_table: standard]